VLGGLAGAGGVAYLDQTQPQTLDIPRQLIQDAKRYYFHSLPIDRPTTLSHDIPLALNQSSKPTAQPSEERSEETLAPPHNPASPHSPAPPHSSATNSTTTPVEHSQTGATMPLLEESHVSPASAEPHAPVLPQVTEPSDDTTEALEPALVASANDGVSSANDSASAASDSTSDSVSDSTSSVTSAASASEEIQSPSPITGQDDQPNTDTTDTIHNIATDSSISNVGGTGSDSLESSVLPTVDRIPETAQPPTSPELSTTKVVEPKGSDSPPVDAEVSQLRSALAEMAQLKASLADASTRDAIYVKGLAAHYEAQLEAKVSELVKEFAGVKAEMEADFFGILDSIKANLAEKLAALESETTNAANFRKDDILRLEGELDFNELVVSHYKTQLQDQTQALNLARAVLLLQSHLTSYPTAPFDDRLQDLAKSAKGIPAMEEIVASMQASQQASEGIATADQLRAIFDRSIKAARRAAIAPPETSNFSSQLFAIAKENFMPAHQKAALLPGDDSLARCVIVPNHTHQLININQIKSNQSPTH